MSSFCHAANACSVKLYVSISLYYVSMNNIVDENKANIMKTSSNLVVRRQETVFPNSSHSWRIGGGALSQKVDGSILLALDLYSPFWIITLTM